MTTIHFLLSGWGDPGAVNVPDKNGQTALMLAAQKGRYDVCELLLKKGANPNLRDKYGKPALQHAAARGYTDICLLLFHAGADLTIKDNFGNTALHAAIRNGKPM